MGTTFCIILYYIAFYCPTQLARVSLRHSDLSNAGLYSITKKGMLIALHSETQT